MYRPCARSRRLIKDLTYCQAVCSIKFKINETLPTTSNWNWNRLIDKDGTGIRMGTPWYFFCGSFLSFVFHVCHAVLSVPCSLVVTC